MILSKHHSPDVTPFPAARLQTGAWRKEAHADFERAQDLPRSRPARLVAVGGLSGSGKSTVAAVLPPVIGPAPGARSLANDRIRKHLFGVPSETQLPAAAYLPDISDKVYAELTGQATRIAELGDAVTKADCWVTVVRRRAPEEQA